MPRHSINSRVRTNYCAYSMSVEHGADISETYGPGHVKMCLMPYANNKVADQPAHPRSLISTFVVRCLDSSAGHSQF